MVERARELRILAGTAIISLIGFVFGPSMVEARQNVEHRIDSTLRTARVADASRASNA